LKNKITAFLLCLCLLASTAVLFSSCSNKTIDLKDEYTVVYADDLSATSSDEVKDFISLLKQKSGQSVYTQKMKVNDDGENGDKFEILIGNTNRPETKKALKKIKGQGYTVTVIGKKVVIVGTTNFLTMMALESFSKAHLGGEGVRPVLEITSTTVENMNMLEITKEWKFVYSAYLRGEGDYVNEAIEGVCQNLEKISDIKQREMISITDKESAELEILAGLVDRPETKAILSGMDVGDYAVCAKDGKLVVTAFNDDMMRKAFRSFNDILKDSVYVAAGDAKYVLLPADFSRIYTDTRAANYITDFPRPDGLSLSGTINVHDYSYEYYYEGEGVDANAYAAYCDKLVAHGYVLKQGHSAEDSIFRTYVNEADGIMLYAAYNAFKHAPDEGTDHKKAIRVIVGNLKASGMVPEELLSPDFSGKLQNSSITAVQPDYSVGKGQMNVITLENGSFIVIDGNTTSLEARDRIYQVLLDLYKRGHDGNEPTVYDPIRIAAWYCTHTHNDHIGAMINFINSYCSNYQTYCVTIDNVIANFPSDEGYYNVYLDRAPNTTVRDDMAELSAKISDAPGKDPGFRFIKVHTGQKLWIGNVELEVLFTHEDLYPQRLHVYNDSSTVIRTTLYHTENGVITEGSKTSMVWLGDAQQASCSIMRATYGSYLESDMVQVAHHIGSGSQFEIYKLISPTWAWYPTDRQSYGNLIAKSSSVGYQVSCKIPSLMFVVLSDFCNYTVTIGANGADSALATESETGVFNAGEKATVAIGRVSKTVTTGFLKTQYNLS